MTTRQVAPSPRRGFTATEMVVVSLLTTLLSSILVTVWAGFCRPARDAATRCRLATEANLAAYALSQDLSGHLTDIQIVADNDSGAISGQGGFQLYYLNPDNTTAVVTYFLRDNRLVRYENNLEITQKDFNSDALFKVYPDLPYSPSPKVNTLAGELLHTAGASGFWLEPWSDSSGNTGVTITLTFASSEKNGNYATKDGSGRSVTRDLSLTYKIVAVKPTAF